MISHPQRNKKTQDTRNISSWHNRIISVFMNRDTSTTAYVRAFSGLENTQHSESKINNEWKSFSLPFKRFLNTYEQRLCSEGNMRTETEGNHRLKEREMECDKQKNTFPIVDSVYTMDSNHVCGEMSYHVCIWNRPKTGHVDIRLYFCYSICHKVKTLY